MICPKKINTYKVFLPSAQRQGLEMGIFPAEEVQTINYGLTVQPFYPITTQTSPVT